MNTVCVAASKQYNIMIGSDLLKNAGEIIKTIKKPCTVAVISNETIFQLYANVLIHSLESSGYRVVCHQIPDGECYKNETTYFEILHFLFNNNITRTDLIIALGGGVVGDIVGFAAATYLRGIPYVQIPTTLLAMVDTSVGGKTAIDLPFGKNLLGVIYQPVLVLCDLNFLNTLPRKLFVDGCAEVIKYAVIYDLELYKHLAKYGLNFDREYVISRCISLKATVVAQDEFDNNQRQKLNLGHTFGHAIETVTNYAISHGSAVAIGLAIMCRYANKVGFCSPSDALNIISLLEAFELPTTIPDNGAVTSKALIDAALSDKKRCGDLINLIVPRAIGDCMIYPVSILDLSAILES